MAKKSAKSSKPSKATRRARTTNKSQASKAPKQQKPEVVEPIESEAEHQPETPEAAITPELAHAAIENAEEMVQPQRTRMLINAVALAVVIVILVVAAVAIRKPQQSHEMVRSGGDSSKADAVLQSGGKVCTNGQSGTDNSGSTNPQSVGMMLQNNPSNDIQTPETVASSSDVSTLQGATCF
jgi:hypothetical protein